MKIVLLGEDAIRLEPIPGPMTIEARSAEEQYSPFHMLASGLATCTFSVLYSWASHAKLDADDLAIEVRWDFADDPHRLGDIRMRLDWPSLPPQRKNAAARVAEMCTIHATLMHPPSISIEATGGESAQRGAASRPEAQRSIPTVREPARGGAGDRSAPDDALPPADVR